MDTGAIATSATNDTLTPFNVLMADSLETTGADFTLPVWLNTSPVDWTQSDWSEKIANRFTTGQWGAHEDARTLLNSDAIARADLAAAEAEKYAAASASRTQYKDEMKPHSDDEVDFSPNHSGDDSEDDDFDEAQDEESTHSESGGETEDPLGEFEKVYRGACVCVCVCISTTLEIRRDSLSETKLLSILLYCLFRFRTYLFRAR